MRFITPFPSQLLYMVRQKLTSKVHVNPLPIQLGVYEAAAGVLVNPR